MSDGDGLFGFDAATFGTLNADDYDAFHDSGTTDETVTLISELAGDGDILELAIGTGRIALPLAAMEHRVSGTEGSPDMVAKLRAKPGGDAIPIVIGDIAEADVDGRFDHAFLVFSTLFNLPDQDAQVRCFANAARHLRPGGTYLVETFVPDPARVAKRQWVETKKLTSDTVWLEAGEHDPVAQTFAMQRLRISGSGIRMIPLPMRYAYPAEIDLMAQLAGFRLAHRWGGWRKERFTRNSTMHVSIYSLPA